MALFKTITQGGQVHIHQLHMLKQIVSAGIIVALITGSGFFVVKSLNLPSAGWRVLSEVTWARFMVATNPAENHKQLTQMYTAPKGVSYKRHCLSILNDPLLQKTSKTMERLLEQIFYQSLKFAGYAFFLAMIFWFYFGKAQQKAQHQRGNTIVPWKSLASFLKRQGEASDISLPEYLSTNVFARLGRRLYAFLIPAKVRKLLGVRSLPLVKDKETSHILLTGTTGSGKTNAFHLLLPQIRERGNKAIVLDVTGDYVSRYYNPQTDIILNPLDERSQYWHPWADCHLDSHYDVFADSLIQPKENAKDPFWDNASRAVLKTALRKYAFQENFNVEQLTKFLLSSSEKDFEAFFKNTEAATFTVKNNEKTTGSIRSVLSSQIEGLHQLESFKVNIENAKTVKDEAPNDNPHPNVFSIRNWVRDETQRGWLFITARADQRQTLIPLISAWMDISINALMVLPENYQRRLWFVIDELAALQKLPKLQSGLAEGRKYGGCFLVGFQSKPQLEEIYGRNAAEAMLDLFNTKVFFRCAEVSSQQWLSKTLGEKEEAEPQENISYGAHSMRDGVSLTRHTRQKPLVLPAEFSLLKDLECYIKYPGDYPCTKFRTARQRVLLVRNEPFLLKPEKKRDYATMLPVSQSPKDPSKKKRAKIM